MSEAKDFSTYPEGFNEVKAMLTFLPDDDGARTGYMDMFMTMLLTL